MVDWVHANDPNHPVTVSDGVGLVGLEHLKRHAPRLDVYSVNNFAFRTTAQLRSALASVGQRWPGKPLLLHGWGSDSWSEPAGVEDRAAQATRIGELATAIDTVVAERRVLGSVLWEWNDEWKDAVHTPWNEGWDCRSCFDAVPNAEYWGLAEGSEPSSAATRPLKPAYTMLRDVWARNGSGGDVTAPQVVLTSPRDGAAVRAAKVTLSANASDASGVSSVGFLVDGALLATDATPPYTVRWDTTALAHPSSHTIEARATDAMGNVGVSGAVIVTVDRTAPTVTVTSPRNGSTVRRGSTVTITATAEDDHAFHRVEVIVAGVRLCTDRTAPYACRWTVPATAGASYVVKAAAFDVAGNTATSTVTVRAG
jgi:hypothetical protein